MLYSEKIFSYGTLQQEQIQMAVFGRRLNDQHVTSDILQRYIISYIPVNDSEAARIIGSDVYLILQYSGNLLDEVPGKVFDISLNELHQADAYEGDDYKRIQVTLKSGTKAWVYVDKNSK